MQGAAARDRALNNWIPVTDHYPEESQKVIYYFELIGIHRGEFDHADHLRCFHGTSGWLCEDVTHWMPDEGQDLDKLEEPK